MKVLARRQECFYCLTSSRNQSEHKNFSSDVVELEWCAQAVGGSLGHAQGTARSQGVWLATMSSSCKTDRRIVSRHQQSSCLFPSSEQESISRMKVDEGEIAQFVQFVRERSETLPRMSNK